MPNLKNITDVPEVSAIAGTDKVLLNVDGEAKQARADLIKPNLDTIPIVNSIEEGDKVLLNVDGVQKQANASLIKPKNLVGKVTIDGGEVFNTSKIAGESSHAEGMETNALGRYSHTECLGEIKEFKNVTVSNTRVEEKRFDVNALVGKIKLPYVAILYQEGAEKLSMLVKEVKAKETTFTFVGYTRPIGLVDGTYDLILAKGISTKEAAHSEGTKTIANARHSHTEGDKTIVTNAVEKDGTLIGNGIGGHAEGIETIVFGEGGHSEGYRTTASGEASHSEGELTTASGPNSHAEGYRTTASGGFSHSEGELTTASGAHSHAEGSGTIASGYASHAEGSNTTASGDNSHAEGYKTKASGYYSHAEGTRTIASGYASHAEGYTTTSSSAYQHVQGKFNIDDPSGKYAHIVGNGKNDASTEYESVLSNAHTLDWDGNAWYAGDIEGKSMIVKSSTPQSAKRFRITVDDTGVIKAEEVM